MNESQKYVDLTGLTYYDGKIKDYIDDIETDLESDISSCYVLPSGGIPSTDLSSAVQASLGKADTALQTETYTGTITGITMNGASKGTSGVVDLGTVITDVSGKENTSNKVTSLSSSSTDIEYPSAKCVYDHVSSAVSGITTVSFSVVQTLPSTGEANIIYLVPNSSGAQSNIYDEYVYISNNFELIGSTVVDLSNYLSKTNTTSYTPSGDYNPSTKKYVDDSISALTIPTNVSDLNNDSGFITGLFEATYNVTSFADIKAAVDAHKIVYCKISSGRFAFLAYQGGGNYEFQYYRSNTTHDFSNRDEVFVYKITKGNNSDTWETIQRKTEILYKAGTGISMSTPNNNSETTVSIDSSKVLLKDNTASWTPTGSYQPATKKYVDDNIPTITEATDSDIDSLFT